MIEGFKSQDWDSQELFRSKMCLIIFMRFLGS